MYLHHKAPLDTYLTLDKTSGPYKKIKSHESKKGEGKEAKGIGRAVRGRDNGKKTVMDVLYTS